MRKYTLLIILFLFSFESFCQNKDTLFMRNGDVYVGSITFLDREYIFIDTGFVKKNKVALKTIETERIVNTQVLSVDKNNANPFKKESDPTTPNQDKHSYLTPINKADSNYIYLDYTRICLRKFNKEHQIGYIFSLLGASTAAAGLGIYTSDTDKYKESLPITIGVSGVLFLIGTITQIDSYKWIKRAGVRPILNSSNGGVVIYF